MRRKDTYLKAKFKRLAYRRGAKKAIIAIGHSIIKMLYHIIKERVCYLEPENQQPNEQQKHKIVNKHLKALQRLGYKIELPTIVSPQIA